MRIIYLKEFIKSGRFDTITIGSTKEEVIYSLGNKFSFADCGETQIISYGWYEFFYWTETGKVFGIQNDHLQADCLNHKEMIDFKNETWTLDTWLLKDGRNITLREIKEILTRENIAFTIQPTYEGCDENILKCLESKITFDFCSEYSLVQTNSEGEIERWGEFKATDEDDFVLNGIRLFENL